MNNLEKSSKFSHHVRVMAVERVVNGGWSPAASAAAIGASRSILYRWLRRYRQDGRDGLLERSSRPAGSPRRWADAVVAEVRRLREAGLTLSRIAQALHLARSSVHRWLVRLGLSRLLREPAEPVVRYEAGSPGELLHIDTKKLRGFRQPGRKFIEEGGRRWRGAPRQYLHVCVDSRSRCAFARIMEREDGAACIRFLRDCISHFATLGVSVQRILTDNGSAYRGKAMAAEVATLGIRHSFTRIRRPQTNGKAERFIRTAMTEWGRLRWESSELRDAALPLWLDEYNYRRNHSAVGNMPPATRLPGYCEQPIET